jgi:predicted esterase
MISALLLWMPISCDVAVAADPVQTGRFSITFTETHPLSAWPSFIDHSGAMFGVPKGASEGKSYRIEEESYSVYVPKNYDGTIPYGLIAFVSASLGGGIPGEYMSVCDSQRVIWIGGAKVPNERNATERTRITVDAVHNMVKKYRIDPDRIYVAGMSGGGRVASHMAVPYADVFTGAIFFCGCNPLVMPSDQATSKKVDELAKQHRFAFMTGSKDFNQPGTKQVYEQYLSMKYTYSKYFEQAGMGHEMPNKASFTEAMAFLDGPLIAKAVTQLAAGKAAEGKKKWREAWNAYQAVSVCAVAEEAAKEAKGLIANVGVQLDEGAAKELSTLLLKPQAAALRSFVVKWPTELPSTAKARSEAERLGGEEIDKLVAGKATTATLRTFLKTWEGYAVCQRAVDALDALAKDAWTKVDALKPGSPRTKAVAKFVVEWLPTPTAMTANESLTRDVQAELVEIAALATPAAKMSKLQALLSAVKGTSVATNVESALVNLSKDAGAKSP